MVGVCGSSIIAVHGNSHLAVLVANTLYCKYQCESCTKSCLKMATSRSSRLTFKAET